ncbi:hypothetical protein MLD38_036582 [Melastoma candidum]|uniref:Uncharacterized protein n=1 Tax=Melastoma candidum TaxID=119954 RepID=A0ACB9LKJ4_9MYRT|nr:hypothetical protein MLD38_036582 [Melastoma candidum]
MSNLTSLRNLQLWNNFFTGHLPSDICWGGELAYFSADDNNFTGPFDYLSDNHLSGEIPDELGKPSLLFDLNLGNNLLVGLVPTTIAKLSALRRINLAGNNLSGSIPRELKACRYLEHLYFGSNNLTKKRLRYQIRVTKHIISRRCPSQTLNLTAANFSSSFRWRNYQVELIETFMNYQENKRRCVCIIYDPSRSNQGASRSNQGALALKALKLSDSFMDLHRNNNFTGEKLREKNLSWVDIFEDIPIKVTNSSLVSAFMTDLEADSPVTQCDLNRLQFSSTPFVTRNMEFLIECMVDMSAEQQKFQFYYRNLSRQQAQQQGWLQKRRAENMARKAAGEEPLPEEDPLNPIFKPIPEPSRLDSFLITNQIANYCNQVNGISRDYT